jgi:chromate transporter
MDRDLVEDRKWVSRQDYVEGLAFSQLSPGPLAAQLAMYIGWVRAGRVGAALVAAAFIAPSFLMAVLVATAYLKYDRLPWIQDLFYGIGAAVIAIIAQSAYRLSRKTIGKDVFLWGLFACVAFTTVWTGSEIVWLFVLCGVVAVLVRQPPKFI